MLFSKLIKRIIEKRAGKFSAKVSALKGIEPVAYVGSISAAILAICRAAGIEIDEKAVAEIAAGATALYGLIRSVGNWWKNRNK